MSSPANPQIRSFPEVPVSTSGPGVPVIVQFGAALMCGPAAMRPPHTRRAMVPSLAVSSRKLIRNSFPRGTRPKGSRARSCPNPRGTKPEVKHADGRPRGLLAGRSARGTLVPRPLGLPADDLAERRDRHLDLAMIGRLRRDLLQPEPR